MLKQKLRTAISTFPQLLALAEKVNSAGQWLRWRVSRPAYPAGHDIRLHLGCGHIDYPGFVNVDARPRKHVHHVQRIDRLANFADDSVSLIYASHCLEHVPHVDLLRVLREWRRILKPGGTLRLSVPDFDHLVDLYLDSQRDMRSILLPLMGGQDYAFNFHYSMFNAVELSRVLTEAGFIEPRGWIHGADVFSSLPDWSGRPMVYKGRTYPVSLNIEARK
jgi:predicted SAM-dependent methyltransferase